MIKDTYKLKIHFVTPVLGSQSTREITSEFIASKAGLTVPEDEARNLPEELERGTTVFHKDAQGWPLLYDYHVRGFLKEAGRVLSGKDGLPKNLRSKIAQLVFVSPRTIKLQNHGSDLREEMDYFERPLRAETAQGPRVALARSEMLPDTTWFECGLTVYPGEVSEHVLQELLDYGFDQGLMQFRGGGFGRFRYELVKEDSE